MAGTALKLTSGPRTRARPAREKPIIPHAIPPPPLIRINAHP
jgi:hypothetical protein